MFYFTFEKLWLILLNEKGVLFSSTTVTQNNNRSISQSVNRKITNNFTKSHLSSKSGQIETRILYHPRKIHICFSRLSDMLFPKPHKNVQFVGLLIFESHSKLSFLGEHILYKIKDGYRSGLEQKEGGQILCFILFLSESSRDVFTALTSDYCLSSAVSTNTEPNTTKDSAQFSLIISNCLLCFFVQRRHFQRINRKKSKL